MADEIKITVGMGVNNGNYILKSSTKTTTWDQTTAAGGNPGTVIIGSGAEETIAFGDVTPGFVQFTNLDPTNFVKLGFSTTVYGIKLLPAGGPALFYVFTGASIFARADTADCNVLIQSVSV